RGVGATPRYVLTSNFAIVPEVRLTQMSFAADIFARSGHVMNWRYDVINKELAAMPAAPAVRLTDIEDAILAFSPSRTPGIFGQNDTAQIQGSIVVADLMTLKVGMKAGTFMEPWLRIRFGDFISANMHNN